MEDAIYPFLKLYQRLPGAVQDVMGRAYRTLPNRVRYGPFYGAYRDRIRLFVETTSPGAVEQMQLEMLRDLVNRAVASVPFYRQFSPINRLEDLQAFPIVGREQIVENREAFLSSCSVNARVRSNTGGSSGHPMELFLHAGRTRPKERAHFDWFWGQCGYVPGARVLMVRGAPLRHNALFEYQTIKNAAARALKDMSIRIPSFVLDPSLMANSHGTSCKIKR